MLCLSTGLVHGVFQTGLRQRHIRSVIEDEICKLFTLSAFRKDVTQRQIQQNHITCWTITFQWFGQRSGQLLPIDLDICSLKGEAIISRSPRSRFNHSTEFRSLRSKGSLMLSKRLCEHCVVLKVALKHNCPDYIANVKHRNANIMQLRATERMQLEPKFEKSVSI